MSARRGTVGTGRSRSIWLYVGAASRARMVLVGISLASQAEEHSQMSTPASSLSSPSRQPSSPPTQPIYLWYAWSQTAGEHPAWGCCFSLHSLLPPSFGISLGGGVKSLEQRSLSFSKLEDLEKAPSPKLHGEDSHK